MLFRTLLIILLIAPSSSFAQSSPVLEKLFRNSYEVFALQRNDAGVYRDSKLFSGTDYHPASISNTGIGLVALCIADSMGWESDAEELALVTLKSVTGHHPVFFPDRNSAGFFRHWLDMETGAQAWGSEYSTIDTEILVAGALFCAEYFQTDSISFYATQLWNSIDHGSQIDDPVAGTIFREQDAFGLGIAGTQTLPYNEYMIAAWMAYQADMYAGSPAVQLWNTHYADPDNLPKHLYGGYELLSDQPQCLSSFVHQFNYYLCHAFSNSAAYLNYFESARQADSLWWATSSAGEDFEWGHGAGSANFGSGYHADRIGDNPSVIVSPHIIAGFLPVYPDGKNDLESLWLDGAGIYNLPTVDADTILWRYSLVDVSWTAPEIQGIDYSTMLFGLATLPQFLGADFFNNNNNFFDNTTGPTIIRNPQIAEQISVFPNPFGDQIHLRSDEARSALVQVYNIHGQLVQQSDIALNTLESLDVSGQAAGIYFVHVRKEDGSWHVARVVKRR